MGVGFVPEIGGTGAMKKSSYHRFLRPRYVVLVLLLLAAPVFSQLPQRNGPTDRDSLSEMMTRAQRLPDIPTHLSEKDVRTLIADSGAKDSQFGASAFLYAANLLDGKTLLATENNSQCIDVAVYKRAGVFRNHFEKQWAAPSAYCSPAPCRMPVAFALHQGSQDRALFNVFIPKQVSPDDTACDENVIMSFGRKGDGYDSLKQEILPARCSWADSSRWIRQAAMTAAGQNNLIASVFTGAALAYRQSLVTIYEVNGRIRANRLEFQSRDIETYMNPRPPSACMSVKPAKSEELPIPETTLKQLVEQLQQIDLTSERCPKLPNGDCAYIFDGARFDIIVGNSPVIGITDVAGLKGVRAENPALMKWAYKVVSAANVRVKK